MSQRTVELWLANDSGLYETLQELISEAIDRGDTRGDSERILADGIQDLVEQTVGGAGGLMGDLIQEALEDVDYMSLAESELAEYGDEEWTIEECSECDDTFDPRESEGGHSGLCQSCYEAAEKESS